jgi:hypothetical protein
MEYSVEELISLATKLEKLTSGMPILRRMRQKYSQQRPQPLFPKQQVSQPKVMNAPSSDPAFNNVPYESYSGKAPPTASEVSVDQINKMRTVAYESYQKIQQLQKEFEQVAAELKTILT